MSLYINACLGCGAQHFPARLRCPHCGGRAFKAQSVREARVTGVVRAHRLPNACPWNCLVELCTAGGVTLLAASAHAPPPGSLVGLSQSADGAIVVSAT
ncbi:MULTISPECIES: zinc ribbon domain-containing protein [Delftia]|uniref:ChsH2 rubredoxin-like zinc ribbon domain-containing protein n=2 Tax=Delftia TaxID=80865 RepID=A0A7T2S7H8_DELAC|nr:MULTISPECIES: zinc ribbon domain-containing protein [Delftia]MBB1649279.1 hypothetical protein [Delftia sp. UME58]MBL8354211.1 hypothetical protein [Delftia acidovorans]QPS10352.1 hypothetical protein I6G66_10295 [Delftia acidovorans]